MWGGSIYAVALHDYDVGLFVGRGSSMTETRKPYIVYRMPPERGYVVVQIYAETPEGKEQGKADYLREFMVYEARVDHETATTATIKRRPYQ